MTDSTECNMDVGKLEEGCGRYFSTGECVIYKWVDYIREYLEKLDRFVEENTAEEIKGVQDDNLDEDDGNIIADVESLAIVDNFTLDELQSNAEFQYDLLAHYNEENSKDSIKIYTGMYTDYKHINR